MGFLRRPKAPVYTTIEQATEEGEVEERPTAGDEMRESIERQRKISERSQRRGRASTVLTPRNGGGLG